MKFQVANREVLTSIGVAHVSIHMYGYTFKLPIFVYDLGDIDCIFGLDTGKVAGIITFARTDRIWFNANEHENQNSCLGVIAMLSAIFKQYRELNLNRSRLQL